MSGYVPKPGDRVVVSREVTVETVLPGGGIETREGLRWRPNEQGWSFAPVVETVDVAFDDVQAGDRVVLSYDWHEFDGDAWVSGAQVMVGVTSLSLYGGSSEKLRFVRASRVKEATPPLPTEVGAVIVASGEGCGGSFQDLLLIRTRGEIWVGVDAKLRSITSDQIASFRLAKVVPA